jgi:Fe-S cluster assembly scaffold protein SufB
MSRVTLVPQHGVFHIPATDQIQTVLVDLGTNQDHENHIIIAPQARIDLLILNGSVDKLIHLECSEYVQGSLQIAMMQPNKNITLQIVMNTGVELDASLADFTHGKGKMIVNAELLGRGARLEWRTAALSSKDDRKYYSVSFHHTEQDTYANMTNYGVTEGKSSLQFSGTGHIVNGAKNSKTHQNAKIMVFDPQCLGRADPILKIDENEVEASHAATVGKVNDEHLFYLCSRGLTKQEAKRVITLGYLNPIIQFFTDTDLKASLSSLIETLS